MKTELYSITFLLNGLKGRISVLPLGDELLLREIARKLFIETLNLHFSKLSGSIIKSEEGPRNVETNE